MNRLNANLTPEETPEECDHHWHVTGTTRNYDGSKIQYERCCHCGQEIMQHIPAPSPEVYTSRDSQCGPWKPDTDSLWDAPR